MSIDDSCENEQRGYTDSPQQKDGGSKQDLGAALLFIGGMLTLKAYSAVTQEARHGTFLAIEYLSKGEYCCFTDDDPEYVHPQYHLVKKGDSPYV